MLMNIQDLRRRVLALSQQWLQIIDNLSSQLIITAFYWWFIWFNKMFPKQQQNYNKEIKYCCEFKMIITFVHLWENV